MTNAPPTTDAPPTELVIDAKPAPGDASDGSGTAMAPAVGTVLGAGLLAKFVAPLLGLAALGVGVALFVILRKPQSGRFILRIEDGTLVVTRERGPGAAERIALSDLRNVSLDRKTSQVSGRSIERVQIALERSGADPLLVPDARIVSIEGQEWQAKIRVFLRKHGWLPEDER